MSLRSPAGRQSGHKLCGVVRAQVSLARCSAISRPDLTALGEAGPPPHVCIPALKVPSPGHSDCRVALLASHVSAETQEMLVPESGWGQRYWGQVAVFAAGFRPEPAWP